MKKESKIKNYVKESHAELKKVTWPKKDEVTNSTVIVIIVIIIISGILGSFDWAIGSFVMSLFEEPSLKEPSGVISMLPFVNL